MNVIDFNATEQLITVQINHKIFAAPASLVAGYSEDFLESASEEALEEVGFEFAYGVNAY